MGAALEVRGIPSAEQLSADVEGDIEDVEGVLRITHIRLRYRLKNAPPDRDKIQRVLEVYAEKCPAYQSVKECITCSWELES